MIASSIGLCVVFFLGYLTYFHMGVVCPVCSATHVLVLFYTFYSITVFLGIRKAKQSFAIKPLQLQRLLAFVLAMASPPLLVGFASQFIPPQGSVLDAKVVDAVAKPPLDTLKIYGQYKGSLSAPVYVVLFSDFQCPHCQNALKTLEMATASGNVSQNILLHYRHFPISKQCNPFVSHNAHGLACNLARASLCAGKQGLFSQWKSWVMEHGTGSTIEDFAKNREHSQEFKTCPVEDQDFQKLIQEDTLLANQLGIEGTPLIYVNGRVFRGPFNVANWIRALNAVLP